MSLQIHVEPASKEQKEICRHLMQLYQHDLSEYNNEDIGNDGLFDYRYFDAYWTEEGRQEGRIPYLVSVGNAVVGFVLKNMYSYLHRNEPTHSIAEFFILRKWRSKGIGSQVAIEVFGQFPGEWEIGQERDNEPAQRFWRRVIAEYTGGDCVEIDSTPPAWDGPVQVFRVGHRKSPEMPVFRASLECD